MDMGATMKKQRGIRNAVIAAFLAASAVSGAALAVDEVEFNGVFLAPQKLTIGGDGSVTVNAVMGVSSPTAAAIADVDYFSFDGKAGDLVTIDIDEGIKTTSAERSVDTIVAIFGPCAKERAECFTFSDDALALDPGSINLGIHRPDSYIEKFRLPMTGTYTVGVSSNGRPFNIFTRDGSLSGSRLGSNANGRYILIISGVTSPMLHVSIEVKPGSREPAPVNPKSKGKVPVALLSQPDFRPLEVDRASLKYGATGKEATLSHCNKEGRDVNGDGVPDLVCHFENEYANFDDDSTEGVLTGQIGGKPLEGRGYLKVLPREKD